MDFKTIIAETIAKEIDVNVNEISNFVEVPKEKSNGDFSFPCFKLAKNLKKAPQIIAEELKESLNSNVDFMKLFEKIDVVNGFLNFYVSKVNLVKEATEKFAKQDKEYGKSNEGKGKKIIIEYSSPNIAKPFHIGHLKTTIIGHSLYNIYKNLGYETFGLNHLGDFGTQFAKLIEGYKRWGAEYDFSTDPIDKLADIYRRINQLCTDDEEVLEICRENFKKLEDGNEEYVALWTKFKELSLVEFEKIYEELGITFDEYDGEAFYSDKIPEVLDILENSGAVVESEGAKIIDLTDQGIDSPIMVQKSNGSSIYATRDLATILYRVRKYDYDKNIYVVGNEQGLYFRQLFAAAKYLGIDQKYIDGLEHVGYGIIMLPEGKMSTRKGNFIKAQDIIDETVDKVRSIMKEKNTDLSEKEIEIIANQVGVGAIVFDYLHDNRNKTQIFDINQATNFNGETGPYIQYTAVRTKSVIEKAGGIVPKYENINLEKLTDEYSINVLKLISLFGQVLNTALEKSEPSILTRYLIEVAGSYSSFYNANKIINEDKELQDARIYLTHMVNVTLSNGLKLLGIEVPEKM